MASKVALRSTSLWSDGLIYSTRLVIDDLLLLRPVPFGLRTLGGAGRFASPLNFPARARRQEARRAVPLRRGRVGSSADRGLELVQVDAADVRGGAERGGINAALHAAVVGRVMDW